MNDKTRLEWVWMRRRECGLKQLAFARIRVHAAAGEGFSAGVWFPSAPQGFSAAPLFPPHLVKDLLVGGDARRRMKLIIASDYHYSPWHRPLKVMCVFAMGERESERERRTTAWPVTSQKRGFDGLSRNLAHKLFVGVVKDERDDFATINNEVILNFVRYQYQPFLCC